MLSGKWNYDEKKPVIDNFLQTFLPTSANQSALDDLRLTKLDESKDNSWCHSPSKKSKSNKHKSPCKENSPQKTKSPKRSP